MAALIWAGLTARSSLTRINRKIAQYTELHDGLPVLSARYDSLMGDKPTDALIDESNRIQANHRAEMRRILGRDPFTPPPTPLIPEYAARAVLTDQLHAWRGPVLLALGAVIASAAGGLLSIG